MDNAFITNVFITITFFLPGFVAKWVSNYLNNSANERSDLEKTIVSLSWNVPPIFGAWFALSLKENNWHFKFLSTTQLIAAIEQMPCMLYYFVFALVWAFIIGRLIENVSRRLLTNYVAKSRKESGLPQIEEGLAWERFIGSESSALIKTYPISDPSKAIGGTLSSAYRPGDIHKGITLELTDKVKTILPYLENPERTFVDFESQLVFEIYFRNRVEAALDKVQKNSPTELSAH